VITIRFYPKPLQLFEIYEYLPLPVHLLYVFSYSPPSISWPGLI